MLKNLFKSIFVTSALVLSLGSVSAATPNERIAEYARRTHVVGGVEYKISDSQNVKLERYLKTHTLTDDAVNTAIAKADEAKKIVNDSGVKKLSDLPASTKSTILSLAQDAGKAVGVTVAADKVNKNIIIKDSEGNILEAVNYKNDKLVFTGSNYTSLFIAFASLLGLSAIIFKMKKDFDEENN